MVGASSYDAFMILVRAIEKAGTDRKAIVAALKETKDYDGLTGKLSRFVKGESVKPVQFQIVKDGKWRHHGVVTDPEIITPPVN
jgi:branched-chain amino acid transport system substrate-binding protein